MNIYESKAGERRTKDDWEQWSRAFYKDVMDKDQYQGLPANWFDRVTKVLRLTEVYND